MNVCRFLLVVKMCASNCSVRSVVGGFMAVWLAQSFLAAGCVYCADALQTVSSHACQFEHMQCACIASLLTRLSTVCSHQQQQETQNSSYTLHLLLF